MSDYVLDWYEGLDKINPTQIVPQIDTVHGAAGPLVQRRLLSDPEVDPISGVANLSYLLSTLIRNNNQI